MKFNLIRKNVIILLIALVCLIGQITPALASEGTWIDCDTSTAASSNNWMHPWAYKFSDGSQAHGDWYYIDGYWYYFKNYTIVYGKQNINGKWYFFDYITGHLLTNQYVPEGRYVQIWANENGELQS